MAAKRLRDDADSDRDSDESSDDKRMRTVPSISTVFRDAMAVRTLQNFVVALEPLLRKVVNEEVERGLVQGTRSLQRQIKAEEAPTLQLIFSESLSLPVFTGSKIEDVEKNPLRVLLVDTRSGSRSPVSPPSPVRVEIVALKGDFPRDDDQVWTSDEFERSIVKERTGKRPLLAGDVLLTLRDGSCTIGELSVTDNSSWIRSRCFRLGARVAAGSCNGLKIKEAMTQPFMVKDHRGELYRKHHPPRLNDEVWRLERIGKDGVFHRKLHAEGIDTVQGFVKLSVVDEARLRKILGVGMSDKMWEGTIDHARTCDMGNKCYLYRTPRCALLLNPVCQVQLIAIDGQTYLPHSLHPGQRAFVDQLVLEAYKHWGQLEEVDEAFGRATLLQQCNVMPQIAMAPSSSSMMYQPTNQQDIPTSTYQSGGLDLEAINGCVQLEFGGWIQKPGHSEVPIHRSSDAYNMLDFSSNEDEESNPSQGYSGGF